jgi:hypothetical protein
LCALGRMTRLTALSLSSNALTGRLACLRNLTALQVQLDVSSNHLHGALDVVPNFPKLLFLNASHNLFAGLVVPDVASAALTQLAVVDLSANVFTDRIESLTPFVHLATSLTRLLLADNAFVGSCLQLNVEQLPQLVELDVSNNAGLSGVLTWTHTAASECSMVVTAVGSTRFECPTPPFPSTMIVTLSACRQVYDQLLVLLGYVVAGAVIAGLVIFAAKWHRRPRFLRLVASVLWCAGCLSFLNDGRLLFRMVVTVTGQVTNCDIVNHRGVFEVFLPLRDTNGFYGARQGFIGPRGPYCHCGNTTEFGRVEQQLDLRVQPPSRDQTFGEYMTVYDAWAGWDSTMSPGRQRAAFHDLCLRFPRCNLVPGSSDHVCGDRYDHAWSHLDHYGFLVCVVLFLVWRGVLEALKLSVIVASFVQSRVVGREFALPFLQSSPFLPLMGVFGVDWVDDVLRYQRTYQDHLRFFAIEGVSNALPFLALQLYYFNRVQHTGLDTLSYVSLAVNFILLPLWLIRSGYAFYRVHMGRVVLVDSILAYASMSASRVLDSESEQETLECPKVPRTREHSSDAQVDTSMHAYVELNPVDVTDLAHLRSLNACANAPSVIAEL